MLPAWEWLAKRKHAACTMCLGAVSLPLPVGSCCGESGPSHPCPIFDGLPVPMCSHTSPASKYLQGSSCQSLYLAALAGFLSVDLSGLVPKSRTSAAARGREGCRTPRHLLVFIPHVPVCPPPHPAPQIPALPATPDVSFLWQSPRPSPSPRAETFDHPLALLCAFSSFAVSSGWGDQDPPQTGTDEGAAAPLMSPPPFPNPSHWF